MHRQVGGGRDAHCEQRNDDRDGGCDAKPESVASVPHQSLLSVWIARCDPSFRSIRHGGTKSVHRRSRRGPGCAAHHFREGCHTHSLARPSFGTGTNRLQSLSLVFSVAVWPNSSVAVNLILILGAVGSSLSCLRCLSLALIWVSRFVLVARCFVVFLTSPRSTSLVS